MLLLFITENGRVILRKYVAVVVAALVVATSLDVASAASKGVHRSVEAAFSTTTNRYKYRPGGKCNIQNWPVTLHVYTHSHVGR